MSYVAVVHDTKSKKPILDQIDIAILRYQGMFKHPHLDIAVNPSLWAAITEQFWKLSGHDCRAETEIIYNGHRIYSAQWAGGVSFYLAPREIPDAD